MYQSQGWAL